MSEENIGKSAYTSLRGMIRELKEKMKKDDTLIAKQATFVQRETFKNRDVLREMIRIFIVKFNKKNLKDSVLIFKGLLKKLEGSDAGSARQTEERIIIPEAWDTWVLKKRDGSKEYYGAEFFTLVRKEDLEKVKKRESWLLEQIYPTHYNTDEYNKRGDEYLYFNGKYLSDSEEEHDES